MRRVMLAALVAVTVMSLAGCGTAAAPTSPATTTVSAATATSSSPAATTPSPTVSETTTPPASAIPAGSIALFGTISGGVKSDSLKRVGGDISWDSTRYEFLRYVPAVPRLDELDWTTSKSYAKSYLWGFTQDGWVYTVRCSTDTGSKDVKRVDPRTGNVVGSFPSFSTDSRYAGFAVTGDRLIYRSKLGKDLFGNRTGGGHVMAVTLGGGAAVKLLDYNDSSNAGTYYAIGDDLVSVVRTFQNDLYTYDIYRVDPATLTLGDRLFTYYDKEYVTFFAGETALYWGQTDPGTGDILVVRFVLTQEPKYFVTISENDPQLVSVDESAGQVLIVATDSTPESPFFTLVDLATIAITDLDVDPGFFSTLIHGTGQFLVLK